MDDQLESNRPLRKPTAQSYEGILLAPKLSLRTADKPWYVGAVGFRIGLMNKKCHVIRLTYGLTLVELMVATVLGMLIVLAVWGVVLNSQLSQATQHDTIHLQDASRFILDNMARAVRQAGYVNMDVSDTSWLNTDSLSPHVLGLSHQSLKATTPGITMPISLKNHRSDVLALRFFGSGSPDDTMLNCAGFGVAAPQENRPMDEQRGWSIYYVATESNGEPALFCKYRDRNRFTAQAIIQGVEVFNVLYGVMVDAEAPLQFFTADEINSYDQTLLASDREAKTVWKKIRAIKIALLIRGMHKRRGDNTPMIYHLFSDDPMHHTIIDESTLPITHRYALRKVVEGLFFLRNG